VSVARRFGHGGLCSGLVGFLLAGALACSGGPTGDAGGGASGGDRGNTSGSGGRTGSGGSGMAMGAGGAMGEMRPEGPPPPRCQESVVGPRAIVRLTATELGNTLRDIFPEAKGSVSLGLADPLDSKDGFINPSKLLVGEDSADKLLTAAKSYADVVVAPANLTALANKFPCVTGVKDAKCAGDVIARYGRRLFRRPLSSEEQTRYVALHTTVAAKTDFAQGLKWALVALMQSPNTLYRRQVGKAMGNGVYKLTPFELASELAYTFTATGPTEELLMKAEAGQLGSRDALVNEARALLQTPAGRKATGEFFRLWLGYDLVTANQRDGIPGFAGLRDKLALETETFIDRIVFTEKGGLSLLLTTPTTTVDGALSTYYGLPAPTATGMASMPAGFGVVTRPSGRGIGLLAQGAILAERSQSRNSSPTKRGMLVRQKFLCLAIPPQPPSVPDLPAVGMGWKTTRQRFEDAHAQGGCAACHRLMDPLGFPLEHFDEGGRYRETENGEPINASGYAIDDAGTMLFAIKDAQRDGQEELSKVLAARPEVAACAAETFVKYLFAQERDCLAGDARNEFVDGKIGFLELAARIAGAPHFSERRE
jgi:hypothetical protein